LMHAATQLLNHTPPATAQKTSENTLVVSLRE
jgi:hypothetical protein